jgi:pimeloyl-ACP methyl ester carboxylesterase
VPKPGIKPKRTPVVIVPGLMGSELWLGSEKIWPNVRYLFTRPENFKLPELRPLGVGEIVHEVVIVPNLIKMDQYNLLGDYLVDGLNYERGKDLFEFAYDWRQDVRLSARCLAQEIENWSITPPITIIAHSLGTLVSRYYVEKYGGKDKIGQIILLGGPHSGTPQALISMIKGADVLPFGLLGDRLREVLTTFPSTYQILPTYPCVYDQAGHTIDIFKDDKWVPEWQRPLLRNGHDFRRELGDQSSVPTVSVFGYGLNTVTKIMVQRTSEGSWQNMDYKIDPKGDDRIPEGSAVLKGSELHPVQQHHGKLFVDNDVKMRLKIELTG